MPLLEAEVAELARRHDDPDLRRELSDLWQLERDRFNPTGRTVEGFADLEQHISSVIQDLEVIQENSYSEKRLSYSEDEDVEDVLVVVGGNTLSRGLTLEGLICSYFLRSAKTYDALLQMGRWFGYREDYEDLPRIWTTGEIRRHFKHLATVEADLRQEIEILQRDPDLDPETMSLRILSDPNGKLDPTSRNKMQASTGIKADYGDRVRVTTHFDVSNREALTDVLTNASSFLAGLAVDSQVLTVDDTGRDGANSVVIANVGHQEIVEYLRSYPFHSEEGSMRPLLGYLEERQKLTWNVAVFSSSGASRNSVDLGVGSFRCWSRPPEAGCPANDTDLGVLRNAKQDEWIDLSTITGEPHDAGEARDLRNARQEALLGFFPVDKDSQPQDSKSTTRERLEAPENLLGLMLAFPRWHDGKGYRKRRNRFSTKPQTQ